MYQPTVYCKVPDAQENEISDSENAIRYFPHKAAEYGRGPTQRIKDSSFYSEPLGQITYFNF